MRIEQDAKLDYKDVLIRSKRSIQRKTVCTVLWYE